MIRPCDPDAAAPAVRHVRAVLDSPHTAALCSVATHCGRRSRSWVTGPFPPSAEEDAATAAVAAKASDGHANVGDDSFGDPAPNASRPSYWLSILAGLAAVLYRLRVGAVANIRQIFAAFHTTHFQQGSCALNRRRGGVDALHARCKGADDANERKGDEPNAQLHICAVGAWGALRRGQAGERRSARGAESVRECRGGRGNPSGGLDCVEQVGACSAAGALVCCEACVANLVLLPGYRRNCVLTRRPPRSLHRTLLKFYIFTRRPRRGAFTGERDRVGMLVSSPSLAVLDISLFLPSIHTYIRTAQAWREVFFLSATSRTDPGGSLEGSPSSVCVCE